MGSARWYVRSTLPQYNKPQRYPKEKESGLIEEQWPMVLLFAMLLLEPLKHTRITPREHFSIDLLLHLSTGSHSIRDLAVYKVVTCLLSRPGIRGPLTKHPYSYDLALNPHTITVIRTEYSRLNLLPCLGAPLPRLTGLASSVMCRSASCIGN
jgi:hypothetical protein